MPNLDIDLSTIKRDPDPEVIKDNEPDAPINDLELFDDNNNNNDDYAIKNTLERRKLLLTIKSWQLNFDKVLKDIIPSNNELNNMPDEDLEQLLQEIKFCVSVRNTTKISTKAFLGIVNQVENVCCAYEILNIRGLTGICAQDADLLDTVKECCLSHMNLCYSRPEGRLLYNLLQSAYTLHIINNSKPQSAVNTPNKTQKDIKMNNKLKDIDNEFDSM